MTYRLIMPLFSGLPGFYRRRTTRVVGNDVLKVRAQIKKCQGLGHVAPPTVPTLLDPIIGHRVPMTAPELLAPAPTTPESQ